MTLTEVTEIRPGCKVRWNDPDDGACSRTVDVAKAYLRQDETVLIECQDGTTLECLPGELTWA